jgi:hypothetical protein
MARSGCAFQLLASRFVLVAINATWAIADCEGRLLRSREMGLLAHLHLPRKQMCLCNMLILVEL